MDAFELELRKRISRLEERIEELEDNFDEKVRLILVGMGLIEGAAEDE